MTNSKSRKCTIENTNPGDRVETRDRTSDASDEGRVTAVRLDGTCTVAWDSGVETPADLSDLQHER